MSRRPRGGCDEQKHSRRVVTLEMPPGATVEDARGYVEQAVAVWCGHDHEAPMAELDGHSVRVKAVPVKRKKGKQAK